MGTPSFPPPSSRPDGNVLRAQFDPLNLQQEEALTMVLYSRADTWLGWGESREADRPLLSLRRIFQLSLMGLSKTFRSFFKPARSAPPKGRLATSIVPPLPLGFVRLKHPALPCRGLKQTRRPGKVRSRPLRPPELEPLPPPEMAAFRRATSRQAASITSFRSPTSEFRTPLSFAASTRTTRSSSPSRRPRS